METAFITIWGERVGAVAWNQKTGIAGFEYDPIFKRLNINLSPIKMPIQSSKNIFSFPELRQNINSPYNTFKGLPGLVADVLPDNYGNQLINMWLASQGRAVDSLNPVEMLCFIGSRGMGALEFEPTSIQEGKRSFSIELDRMVDLAQRLLSEKESFVSNIDKEEESAVMEILKIGTSAGGARPKAVIAYNEKTGAVRSGQTNAPKDFEHWMIKLDGVHAIQLGASKGYGRVEMAYHNMAKACGIEMMPCKLLEENGRAHFMTKRFDRSGSNTKHHIQSFCAMQHFDFNLVNNFSYEQLFQTMRTLKLSYPEIDQMYRRMVFNVLAKNCDDHTKNFSFILKQNTKWALAPAYDICHAYRPGSEWVSRHALSINGKRDSITKVDLLQIAKTVNCSKANEIIDEVNQAVNRWKFFANELEVDSKLRNAIDKTLIRF